MAAHDRGAWEERWSRALGRGAGRPPSVHLTAELSDLRPGHALDAGCGHGTEALWLASRGWRVTGVDFSLTALGAARLRADAAGADIQWRQADLTTWTPLEEHDLVVSLYVHVAGPVEEFVRRLAVGVRPGGTLFLVGHQGLPDQVQVSVGAAARALSQEEWHLPTADVRPRADGGSDAVIRGYRLP